MDRIKIAISGRIADVESAPEVVADNTEYEVAFSINYGDGWNPAVPMTALFVRRDAKYTAVVMDAGETTCTMPPQTGTSVVYIGLTQEEMRTTTPARIAIRRSVRTMTDFPPIPDKDVYEQIIANFAGLRILSEKGAPTTETEGKVNQLYRDEDTEQLYICVDAADGVYTWVPVSGGTGGTSDWNGVYGKPFETVGEGLAVDSGKKLRVSEALMQEIAGKVDSGTLQTAVDNALEEAKASGAFDGANGKSAYDIAVEKGFAGTAEEWIASLQGEDGISPHIGGNGNWYIGTEDTGVKARGEKGETGATGATGADGHTPVKGTDYFTNADKQEIAESAAGMVDVPDKLPNPNALTFTGAVSGSYDGSAPLSVNIPSGGGSGGGGGTDVALGMSGASVGQIAKITAVDESGVPTAWMPVDLPSGGGGASDGWKKIISYTWDANKEYQPLTLDYTTGAMTFDTDPPTGNCMFPVPNIEGVINETNIRDLYSKIPNEFLKAYYTSAMTASDNGYIYGNVTSIVNGGANANVDISSFRFEKYDTVPTFSGLNAKKVKIHMIVPAGNVWQNNNDFMFGFKLSNGANFIENNVQQSNTRMLFGDKTQTISIYNNMLYTSYNNIAIHFKERTSALQGSNPVHYNNIAHACVVPDDVRIAEIFYHIGNGNYIPCNGSVVEVYVNED